MQVSTEPCVMCIKNVQSESHIAPTVSFMVMQVSTEPTTVLVYQNCTHWVSQCYNYFFHGHAGFNRAHNCSCVSRMHRLSLTLPQLFISLPCRFQKSSQLFLCIKSAQTESHIAPTVSFMAKQVSTESQNSSSVSRVHRLSLTLPQLFFFHGHVGFNRAHNCFCVFGRQSTASEQYSNMFLKKHSLPNCSHIFMAPTFSRFLG